MLAHLALFRQRAFVIAVVALVVVIILWNVPALSFIVYPIRLFVTFVHESGHALAALATGGRVANLSVSPDTSGVTYTMGGSRLLIIPAGYLGAALFGALLFYIANTVPYPKTISLVLAIAVAVISLLYASFLSTAWLIGIGMALVLVALWRFADRSVNLLVLDVLAILTGLNAVLDITSLITNPYLGSGEVVNDAAAFTREIAPIVPPIVWAILWALIAIAMLGAAVYFSHIKHTRII